MINQRNNQHILLFYNATASQNYWDHKMLVVKFSQSEPKQNFVNKIY
jgi:hypothetical protein